MPWKIRKDAFFNRLQKQMQKGRKGVRERKKFQIFQIFRPSLGKNSAKKGKKKDGNVLFINASNEYVKSGNKNLLKQQNMDKIVDA